MAGKTRDANIDLLRLLCMAMVVSLHFFSHSEIWASLPAGSVHYYGGHFVVALCRVAVNTMILITGFYGVKSRLSSRKIFMLTARTWCYSILLLCVALYLNVLRPSFDILLRSFFPISTKVYWFITAYTGLVLLSPFLNQLIQALNRNQHRMLLGTMFFLFCMAQYVYPNADTFQVGKGYSLIWFFFLYFIGAYIKLYASNSQKESRIYFVKYLMYIFISFSATILMNWLKGSCPKLGDYIRFFTDYSSPFTLLASVNLFLCFSTLKIKSSMIAKIATHLGPYTLGIYLIHEWPYLRTFVWSQVFHPPMHAHSPLLYLYILLVIAVVFTAGLATGFLLDYGLGLLLRITRLENVLSKIDAYFRNKAWPAELCEKGASDGIAQKDKTASVSSGTTD